MNLNDVLSLIEYTNDGSDEYVEYSVRYLIDSYDLEVAELGADNE